MVHLTEEKKKIKQTLQKSQSISPQSVSRTNKKYKNELKGRYPWETCEEKKEKDKTNSERTETHHKRGEGGRKEERKRKRIYDGTNRRAGVGDEHPVVSCEQDHSPEGDYQAPRHTEVWSPVERDHSTSTTTYLSGRRGHAFSCDIRLPKVLNSRLQNSHVRLAFSDPRQNDSCVSLAPFV